jgi:hypothetical protein
MFEDILFASHIKSQRAISDWPLLMSNNVKILNLSIEFKLKKYWIVDDVLDFGNHFVSFVSERIVHK